MARKSEALPPEPSATERPSAATLAQRHYDRYTGDGRASISVPEWADDDGNPLIVYWQPFTLRDHYRIFGDERPDARAYAKVVARKAEDRDGKKLFNEFDDLPVLTTKADHEVVRRIADAIMQSPSVQEMAERLQRDHMRMAMHRLADRLHKTIDEISAMSLQDFIETVAYHQQEAKRK